MNVAWWFIFLVSYYRIVLSVIFPFIDGFFRSIYLIAILKGFIVGIPILLFFLDKYFLLLDVSTLNRYMEGILNNKKRSSKRKKEKKGDHYV